MPHPCPHLLRTGWEQLLIVNAGGAPLQRRIAPQSQSRSDDVLLGVGVSPRIMPPINHQPRSGVVPIRLPQCETQALALFTEFNMPIERDAV